MQTSEQPKTVNALWRIAAIILAAAVVVDIRYPLVAPYLATAGVLLVVGLVLQDLLEHWRHGAAARNERRAYRESFRDAGESHS